MSAQNKKNHGFTLIELLITVAIIGILSAIAIPSYGKYVTRSKRSEATSNLLQLASLQEQFYRDFRVYAQSVSADNTSVAGTFTAGVYNDDGVIPWSAANEKYFTYTTTSTNAGQVFLIEATGISAENMADYSYAINSNNVKCVREDGNATGLAASDTSCPPGAVPW